MNAKLLLLALLALNILAPALSHGDDQQTQSTEDKIRQALRDTIGQLRDAQNQVVTLQATQAQSDKDKADLQAKLDALTAQLKTATDQAAADKSTSEKTISDLQAQVTDQTGQIGRLNDSVKQWKDAWTQASALATVKETARGQLELKAGLLQRTVDDREAKNLALFKLGNEILTRYEKFGFGDAISAKEPFVGVSRVKLENLVQDYKYKLLDQTVTAGQPLPAAPVPTTTTSSPQSKVTPGGDRPEKTNASSHLEPINPT